ncbi:MAG TPA: hypothetical protein VIR82_11525 [Bradyrhizobium sp.]
MLRKWTLLTLILSLGSSGSLHANPLDSPGTVYIDGLPCNRACQSYMAWSRPSTAQHRGVSEKNVLLPAEMETGRMGHAARPRVARQPVPVPRPARAGMASSSIKPLNIKASHSKNATAPKPTYQATAKTAPVAVVPEKIEQNAAVGTREPERKSGGSERGEPVQGASLAAAPSAESAKPEVAAPPPSALETAVLPDAADATPASAPRTIQQQVAEATGMAERLTAITLERESVDNSDNQDAKSADAGDVDATASTAPANPTNLVALVLARPEINSLSDLNNRNIAIEERQSTASGSVSAALMAVGAAEVQFSKGQAGAIDQLISGEVPAAVLTLASPEAAEWFPDIAGFRTFRLPLSPRARL